MKKNTYEEAFKGFQEHGLYLDTTEEDFVYTEKSDCHCLYHPDRKLKYAWNYVKIGRCSCPDCRKEKGRKDLTIDEKIKIISDFRLEYIEGDLTRVLNPVKIRCKHNHIFSRNFNNINRGVTDCPFCIGTVSSGYWNVDTCQQWIDENMNGYKVLDSKTDNTQLKLLMKCNNANHKAYWTPWSHIHHEKTGCKMCYYEVNGKQNWTLDNAKKLYKTFGYEMLNESDYVSSHKPVYCRNEIGFIYSVSIHFLLRGRTGFSMFRNNKYAIDNIKLYCKLYRPDYELISTEYKQNKDMYLWRYLGDGLPNNVSREFNLSVGAFIISDGKHPSLSKSSLELKCEYLLNKYNIPFTCQKTFNGCVGKSKLRFDFYIELEDKKICIETDGIQHEMPIEYFGGINEFITRQKYDNIKNDYCKNNDIELIRIAHSQRNEMENILINKLKLYEE